MHLNFSLTSQYLHPNPMWLGLTALLNSEQHAGDVYRVLSFPHVKPSPPTPGSLSQVFPNFWSSASQDSIVRWRYATV